MSAGVAGASHRTFDALADRAGELVFVAAMLRSAVDAGDTAWLERCALPWVDLLCPAGADPEVVHAALVAMARHGGGTAELIVQLGFWDDKVDAA